MVQTTFRIRAIRKTVYKKNSIPLLYEKDNTNNATYLCRCPFHRCNFVREVRYNLCRPNRRNIGTPIECRSWHGTVHDRNKNLDSPPWYNVSRSSRSRTGKCHFYIGRARYISDRIVSNCTIPRTSRGYNRKRCPRNDHEVRNPNRIILIKINHTIRGSSCNYCFVNRRG